MRDRFWQDKKVVVTGANGFLGSHLTLNMLENGAQVFGIIKDNIPSSYLCLKMKEKKYKYLKLIHGDIADEKFVNRCLCRLKPDLCLHIAAQAIVGKANKSPVNTLSTNIQGTWNILEALRNYSPQTKIVVASSDKAYGEHKKLPYTEESALLALHPYDASKACADILARTYAHSYGLAVAVTRCANIYGPGDINFSRIIPDTIRALIRNQHPVIRSDGTPLRDYIYIDDAINAYLCLARALFKNKEIWGEAFNFGNGRPISVLELVKLMIKISGKHRLSPKILSKIKIKGEIDRQYLSSRKAEKILKWRPKYSLRQGLRVTFDWYENYLKNDARSY